MAATAIRRTKTEKIFFAFGAYHVPKKGKFYQKLVHAEAPKKKNLLPPTTPIIKKKKIMMMILLYYADS